MGYYTDYEVSSTLDFSEYKDILEELSDYEFDDGFVNAKWYDHEDHMKALSLRYKDVLFTLRGNGEESDDIWCKYFKNGKMQRSQAKIVFDEFNEDSLI